MAAIHSFKEFISEKFDDHFWNVAEEYLNDYKDNLDGLGVDLDKVHRAGEIDLVDVNVEHVWAYDQSETQIGFDVALSVNFTISEADYHYDDYDDYTIWLLAICDGDIENGLDDFCISDISLYAKRNRKKTEMDDSLVPYIPYDCLEDEANSFLEEYYPEALQITPQGKSPIVIEPHVLSERLGLSVQVRRIREDASVFGQLFFEDAEIKLYDEESKTEQLTKIRAKTILVEPQLYFLRNLGSVNNTIIHECVHWVKHRRAFSLAKLYNTDIASISCEIAGGASSPVAQSATEFMEKQANQLAPRIQMPAAPFKAKANEYIAKFMRELNAKHVIDVMEKVIIRLQVEFGVSKQAAKIRLVELGFEEAIGTFTFLDGHYLKPHGFRKGSIRLNQTFSVSAQDAAIQRMLNSELNAKTANGDYLFVDNHFVYNAPLYVQYGDSGNLELTDYARAHMDECCLLFDMKISSRINDTYHTVCFLNREQSDITFEVQFHNGYENAPKQRQIAYRVKQQEEWMNIRRKMTDDPKQCMELLLEWREVSYRDLAKAISRNPETISRTVNGITSPNVKTMALICFGLQLPPIISEKLFQVFGCHLSPTNLEHQWIKEALILKFPESIADIRKYLLQFEIEL